MRWLLLLLAAVGLTAAAPRDWTRTVSRTPAGAFVIGNPAARVKLVEYLSYVCPHCAAFTRESGPTLRNQWVRSGSTSVEVRNAANGALDLAAAMLARCSGPRFAAVSDAIFAAQPQWFERGAEYGEDNDARLNLYPPLARVRALADGSGLTDLARAQGVSPQAIDACFATDADLNRIVAMTGEADRVIAGTPSFSINGKFVGSATWASLEPQLRAGGAR